MADEEKKSYAKTAFGIRDWAPEYCVGQWSIGNSAIDLGIPRLDPKSAYALGARSLLIGVAPVGGAVPPSWHPYLLQALEAGLDIVSGMHSRLTDIRFIAEHARILGRQLHDIRHPGKTFPVGTGVKRSGKRLLTVGTDCALGKKYTALALVKELQKRGHKATFRATGQTGIMISGDGIPIDAVVADFVAGAAELLSPDNAPDHWDIIEGQGSIFHPGYAGVTVGLLHGSQPDAIILCHDPLRRHINGYPNYPIPDLRRAIDFYLSLGKLTNANIRCIGVALNTSELTASETEKVLSEVAEYVRLPAFDPLKSNLGSVIKVMEAML
jgi:uncharacterized NAD-dependent epimerase/dehydratase family protein